MSDERERDYTQYLQRMYIGDGVYVGVRPDDGAVVLATSNGLETTNEIVLEWEVLLAFGMWLDALGETLRAEHPELAGVLDARLRRVREVREVSTARETREMSPTDQKDRYES